MPGNCKNSGQRIGIAKAGTSKICVTRIKDAALYIYMPVLA